VLKKPAQNLATVSRWRHYLQCRLSELIALALSLLCLYLWGALLSYDQDDPGWTHTSKTEQVHNLAGSTGAWFADVSFTAFGYVAYLFPILCGLLAIQIFWTRRRPASLSVLAFAARLIGLVLLILAGTALAEIHFAPDPQLPISTGGALGKSLGQLLASSLLGTHSSTLIFLAFFLLGLTMLTNLSWFGVMDMTGKITLDFLELIQSALIRLLGLDNVRAPKLEVRKQQEEAFPLDEPTLAKPQARTAEPDFDLDIDDSFLLDDDTPGTLKTSQPSVAKAERSERSEEVRTSTPKSRPLSARDEDDDFMGLDAEPFVRAATPPERRQGLPAAPIPPAARAIPPRSMVVEHFVDEDGQPLDWKEEPVIKSVPFTRPAALRPVEPASPAPAPVPARKPVLSPSTAAHFSARDDEEEMALLDAEEAFSPSLGRLPPRPASPVAPHQPVTPKARTPEPMSALDEPEELSFDELGSGRLEPFLGGLPAESQESLAHIASRIINSDRQSGGVRAVASHSEVALPYEPEAADEPKVIEARSVPPVAHTSSLRAERFDEVIEDDLLEDDWREPSFHLAERPAPVVPSFVAEAAEPAPFKAPPAAPSVPEPRPTWMHGSLPPLSLLDAAEEPTNQCSIGSLEATSRLLETRLKEFGVEVKVEEVYPGPVITRFEIQPAPGVKVSRISNLAKDLARSLAVTSVRVVEVIPGRTTVGIEIPNEHRQIVRLSEVLSSSVYADATSPVTLALGHDISGQPVTADLARMPHLLVAGTTGSGKSVGVNAMILSILLKSTPDEARLIMIDPKMLELSIYEGIPHLLCPVVTDMKEAANALRWSVAEMERRYKLMAAMGVRNLAGFNQKVKTAEEAGHPLTDPLFRRDSMHDIAPQLQTLPTIVVIVDEFADMMMIVGKKVEELIARIAQKARAAGIHLILATQRPSVDVITGLIKANIPTRIAFQVSSKIDSRTILDMGGAEQLLGHGDMLYMPSGNGHPVRVHGAFVSDDEVHRVVEAWKQRGQPDYIEDILRGVEEVGSGFDGSGSTGDSEGSEEDPLYDEAVRFVTESRRASISAVQRKLKIGYNRAARMIEAMEVAGVVTSMSTNGSREVIAPPPIRD